LLLVLGGCQPAVKPATETSTDPQPEVQEFMLDNGMKIIVKEDHRSPVVVSQVWYKVGGSYEHNGITGVSHALEHMMFKGTENLAPGKFSEIIAANGGRENAFTGKDYTAYFQTIASDRLELCLRLEADRMRNLILDAEEFKKEIEVIKEERRMRTEDDPTALTYERFNAVAFLNSPYAQPIIGWMQDLDSMTIDDLSRWYRTWYAPNNATLVVSGDVDARQVYALAKTWFGPLQPSDIPPLKPRREVEQQGERRITVKAPATVPYLMMGYQVPVLNTLDQPWEAYALEVLAGVLDGGNSSRLSDELVRGKAIAAQAGAGYDLYARQDTLFLLSAAPSKSVSLPQLEQALLEQVGKLQQQPPSAAELERVKAQVMAFAVYEQDSTFYQAMQLGMLETIGLGWEKKADYLHKIQAVTAEQVQQVARKYLSRDRLTVAVLDPLPIEDRKPRAAATGGRHDF
jgi:zinc protease